MQYSIIPTAAIVNLILHYKVMNQIFKDGNLLPFMMIEDYFTPEKVIEIEANDGIIFQNTDEYFAWLEQQ